MGAVASLIGFSESLDAVSSSPALGPGMVPVLLAMTFVGLVIPLALMWLIARRASVVAKWLLVLHVVITSVIVALGVMNWNTEHAVMTLMTAAAAIMRAMSLKYLFTPAAREWFEKVAPAPSADLQA